MAEPDAINELIREIATVHHIAVSRDDPILILHTMNARLIQDHQRAQQVLIDAFKSELEASAQRWQSEATARAERVLNASLTASSALMDKHLQESARELTRGWRQEVNASYAPLARPLVIASRLASLNLLAGGRLLLTVIVLITGQLLR